MPTCFSQTIALAIIGAGIGMIDILINDMILMCCQSKVAVMHCNHST